MAPSSKEIAGKMRRSQDYLLFCVDALTGSVFQLAAYTDTEVGPFLFNNLEEGAYRLNISVHNTILGQLGAHI